MLRMAVLDRIRGWFYYVFIRGKDKRSEDDQSIPIDPGVMNRPIRFKLTGRTDDPKHALLSIILQIHARVIRNVNAQKAFGVQQTRTLRTLWSSCSRGYKSECSC